MIDERIPLRVGILGNRGPFVVFEGIDGSGTTTQVARVAQRLRGSGHDVHETREPSSGPYGKLARQLLSEDRDKIDPRSLGLLFAADRLDHYFTEIAPALESGKYVLCDRYILSGWAYQSLECDPRWIREINSKAPWPDVTLVLEVSPGIAWARVNERQGDIERFEVPDLQRKLAAAYRRFLEAPHLRRVVSVNADRPVDWVTEGILSCLGGFGLR